LTTTLNNYVTSTALTNANYTTLAAIQANSNTWSNNNIFNSLPTTSVTSAPNSNQFITRGIADNLYLTSATGLTLAQVQQNSNTFTQNNIFKAITFTNTTSERQITLFRQIDANVYTHYGFNVEVLSSIGTLRYHAPHATQHIFSLSTTSANTAYSNILTINANGLTLNTSNLTITNGNLVFTTGNKTITNGTGNVLTLPTSTTILIGNNTTDTLTNKTLTGPIIDAITLTTTVGNKISYFNGFVPIHSYYSEIQGNTLRQIVPSYAGHYFMCGTTDEVIIKETDTTFKNNLICEGNLTFSSTGTGVRLTYFTGYTTAVFGAGLRHNLPSANSQKFSINALDIVSIASDGLSIINGDMILPSGAGTKIEYNGASGGYYTETQIGVMRTRVPANITHA
jgi:hypothetical protein